MAQSPNGKHNIEDSLSNAMTIRFRLVGASAVVLALIFIGLSYRYWQSSQDPFKAQAVINPPFTSLTYAYHTSLWWHSEDYNHLAWTRLSNFSHIKQVFAWENIEPARGRWIWYRADQIVERAEQAGVKIVARLSDAPAWAHPDLVGEKDVDYTDAPPTDLEDFGNYCATLSARYKGRIDAYQIWNEPNLSREWGNARPVASAYVDLLATCSQAIRANDPDAILISAGLAPTGNDDDLARRDDLYLQDLYDAGFRQWVDVVGVHAPGFSMVDYSPDQAERDGRGRWATFRRVEDLRKIMIANQDAQTQMAILEMGWTLAPPEHRDYAWFAVTEEEQAQNLLEAYTFAAEHWRPWVGLMTTIYLADPLWTEADEQFWFSITNGAYYTRPAFHVLANMPKYCGDRVIPYRDPGSAEALGLVPTNPCD